MDVVYDTDGGMLFDFFIAISYNKKYVDMLDVYKAHGVSCYKEVEESFRYIWDGLDTGTPGLEALTAKISGKSNFITSYLITRLHRWKTALVFIEKIMRLFQNELRYEILSYYDEENHELDYYKKITENSSDLHRFILKLDQTAKVKLDLIGIANGSSLITDALKDLFTVIAGRVADVYQRYSETISVGSEKMQKLLCSDEFILLQSEDFKEMYRKHHFKTAWAAMSFLNPITIMYGKDGEDITSYFGVENKYVAEHLGNSIYHHTLLFKALSDDSRIRIIELLREKEMYIGEIAKALDMPLTTLAYHIRTLHMADILITREEGKKTYCKFKPYGFVKAAEVLNNLSGMDDGM